MCACEQDEIGTEAEALAARSISQRGVQLVATAHGGELARLIKNPTLSDLIGGIQACATTLLTAPSRFPIWSFQQYWRLLNLWGALCAIGFCNLVPDAWSYILSAAQSIQWVAGPLLLRAHLCTPVAMSAAVSS